MAFALFAANKNKTGAALLSKLTDSQDVLLTLFRQIDNDQQNKKKNFDWQSPLNVKLSEDEVGDFIRAVRTAGESKFYHTFEGNVCTGSFKFYTIPAEGDKPARSGFGLSVTKGDLTVKVGFSLGAAERFMEFLRFCLDKKHESGFIEDLAKEKEYREKTASKKKTESAKPKTEEKAAEKNEDGGEEPDF